MSSMQIFRTLALPETGLVANALYLIRNTFTGQLELAAVGADGITVAKQPTKTEIQQWIDTAVPESAVMADKLSVPRNISATGDATWAVSFDGSADATAVLTLSTSGATAGTYGNFTVDAKGRITASRALAAADIPSLPGGKITSAISVDTTGNAATATLASAATKLAVPRFINGVSFDGTGDITINAVDSTARIATTEKGMANGVASLGADGLVPASQLPSFVDDVIEVDAFEKLPGRSLDPLTNGVASKGKIYVVVEGGNTSIYRWSGASYISIPTGVGISDSSLKLTTARNIAITGDATWNVTFDGSANVTAALTLADSGVVSGIYGNITVDSKGRITSLRNLIEADMPTLTYVKVESSASVWAEGSW